MNDRSLRILVADDEKDLVWALERMLSAEGYDIVTAHDGVHVLAAARRQRIDLFILDILMPFGDGLWVCEQLRKKSPFAAIPILFLTACSSIDDRVNGLDKGGDDYLVKPFDMSELKARVRALLRRKQREEENIAASKNQHPTFNTGPFTLIAETREVRIEDKVVRLTPKEFDLLHHLMLHFGEVLSSEDLLRQVWGYPAGSNCTGVVRWHVKCLRDKIEPSPSRPVYLRVIPHHGYILRSGSDQSSTPAQLTFSTPFKSKETISE